MIQTSGRLPAAIVTTTTSSPWLGPPASMRSSAAMSDVTGLELVDLDILTPRQVLDRLR